MSGGGGGGGKNSVNFELNLVPYIDLMSTLICFLLMTAVWQELDAMQSNAPPKATSEMPDKPQPTPPPNEPKKVMLTVAIGIDKVDFAEDDKITSFPNVGGNPDLVRVVTTLKDWKQRFPDRKDVVLATDNKAKYKHLVQMMDTLIAEQFPDVAINLN
jgi:biopolymer transport protein TolR